MRVTTLELQHGIWQQKTRIKWCKLSDDTLSHMKTTQYDTGLSECSRDEVLRNKVLYKSTVLYFTLLFTDMQTQKS